MKIKHFLLDRVVLMSAELGVDQYGTPPGSVFCNEGNGGFPRAWLEKLWEQTDPKLASEQQKRPGQERFHGFQGRSHSTGKIGCSQPIGFH